MLEDYDKSHFDIIVAGAGPAGSSAAAAAAHKNCTVLLLDRKKNVGQPVRCGEGISEAALLKNLGKIKPEWVSGETDSASIISPAGHEVTIERMGKAVILDREKFDLDLVNEAIKKGAEFLGGCNVTGLVFEKGAVTGVNAEVDGKKTALFCKVLIIADGVESAIAPAAGIKTAVPLHDMEVCHQYLVSGCKSPERRIKFYVGGKVAPGGYIWVFPKRNGLANIGIGIDGHSAGRKKPEIYLKEFLEKHFPDVKIEKETFGGVPVCPQLEKPYGPGFLITGDAARQVNSVNGGGLSYSLTSGQIAGKTASGAVLSNDFTEEYLSSYYKRWQSRLGKKKDITDRVKDELRKIEDKEKDRIAEKLSSSPFNSIAAFFARLFMFRPKLLFYSMRIFLDYSNIAAKVPMLLIVLGITIFSDQASKAWAVANFDYGPVPVFGGELKELCYINVVKNYGAAFSTEPHKIFPFIPRTVFFAVITAGAAIIMALYYFSLDMKEKLKRFSLVFILGGAAGNLIDRVRHGFVYDFMDCDFPDFIMERWPVWNAADAFITIGVAIFIFTEIKSKKKGTHN
ncbi:MAG: signal peptidase II [Fibrobacterota bacterium]